MTDYAVLDRTALQKLVRERGLGMDGAPGKTSWVAVSSRATMEAALRAADAGQPLTLPLESAGGDAAKAAQMFAEAVAILTASSKAGLDEPKVRELARDEAQKLAAPHTLVMKAGDTEPVDVGMTHKAYDRVLNMLLDGLNPYLVGPPACGKTHMGRQLAKALAKHFGHADDAYILHADSWNADMMDWRVSGTVNPLSGAFNATPFHKAMVTPGLYLADEADKMNPTASGCFNLAMDNAHASFACGLVLKHKHARIMGAGNTPMLGATPQYPDRNAQPADFRDRWTLLEMDYDEALERKLALHINPDAGEWVDFVQQVRARINKSGTPILATPRATVQGAKLLLRKWSRKDIEHATLWKGAPAAMVARAKGDA